MLTEARIAKKMTLEQVEQGTKIRLKFLQSIENDSFSILPSLSYAKGFVKNYSEFLGLDSNKMLAFFRRQTEDTPKSTLLPKQPVASLNKSWTQLTPSRFIVLIIGILLSSFLLYLGVQYSALQRPPALIIESPQNQMVLTEQRVDILGKTDSDATVMINGVNVTVREDGNFFDQVALETGINKLTIVATSRLGKTTTIVREVGVKK